MLMGAVLSFARPFSHDGLCRVYSTVVTRLRDCLGKGLFAVLGIHLAFCFWGWISAGWQPGAGAWGEG